MEPLTLKPLTLKLMPSLLLAAATFAVMPPVAHAQAPAAGKVYKAPEFMDGEKQGAADGNPLEVGGKALWRFDQIWPDDPLTHDNYKPLLWAGDHWDGAYDFGGQPGAKVEGGKVTLAVRGGWGGGGTMPGSKLSTLVFLAPAQGHYTVTGTVRAGTWQGDGANVSLSFLKYDPVTKKVSRLRSVATPKDTDVKLEGIEADLSPGQELILAPMVAAMYTASNLEFTGLQIQQSGPAAPPKIGDVLTVSGKPYKIIKVEGKTITLTLSE